MTWLLRSAIAAFLAAFLGWSAVAPSDAVTHPSLAATIYAYDGQHHTADLTYATSVRGPPGMYDASTNACYADGMRSLGASSCPHRPTTPATYGYDDLGRFVQIASRSGGVVGELGSAEAGSVVVRRSDVAAKSADEAVDAYTHGYKYHPRIRQRGLEDLRAHNFPYSFDDVILRQKPTTQADGSLLYRKVGEINGKSGTCEIAVNPDTGVIFHRSWKP